jgi:hypothetical protein
MTTQGNRIEEAPPATGGRRNVTHSAWVGPEHDVEWIIDHNAQGQAVTGYRLVPKPKQSAKP